MGWGMRYEEYLKQATRLEKEIANCLSREIKAASGSGPWYVKLFPGLRSTTINVANRKRGVLARERAKLEREAFADPSTVWNADAAAVFRRAVPSSPEAIEHLRLAADAAFDIQH
jgi:hypothetical protein